MTKIGIETIDKSVGDQISKVNCYTHDMHDEADEMMVHPLCFVAKISTVIGEKIQARLSVEDIRCVLRHHWVYDKEVYPAERQRIQMSFGCYCPPLPLRGP